MPRTFDGLRRRLEPTEQPPGRTIEDDYRDLFASAMGQRVLVDMLEETGEPCHEGASDATLREADGARKFIARLVKRSRRSQAA